MGLVDLPWNLHVIVLPVQGFLVSSCFVCRHERYVAQGEVEMGPVDTAFVRKYEAYNVCNAQHKLALSSRSLLVFCADTDIACLSSSTVAAALA